ncbi:MAG: NtaA/DmoA family FMN-dependent monooxygenase [Janthinobacterium lividum]
MSGEPSARDRQIHVCLLDMATVSHNNYGLWAHPENQKTRYTEASFWVEIARLCEEAKLDALFFADLSGIAAGFRGTMDVAIREGMHVPILDPVVTMATMAASTTHLGFGATVSATYEHPFGHARRMSTLDHLTGGRAGWNVVMSYTPNANDNYGFRTDLDSAGRYDRADEFMEVCYRLWEESWEDDAVVADRVDQVYADPAKVHRIDHVGEHYRSAGPHLLEPSPQRTPVIFQAGMSERGRRFAATHAEVAFLVGRTPEDLKQAVVDIRDEAQRLGRGAYALRTLAEATVITGANTEEARAKEASFRALTRPDGYLAHLFGNGFDPTAHPRERLLSTALAMDGFGGHRSGTGMYPVQTTVGDMIDKASDMTNNSCLFTVGSPEDVADAMEGWMEEFDLDGFLLRNLVHPGTVADFGRYVVPELQRRGRYRTEYEGTTLRENLFGVGHRRLPDTHPGSAHRRSQRPTS